MNLLYFFILLFVLNKPMNGMKRHHECSSSTGKDKAPSIPLENKVENFSFVEITIIADVLINTKMETPEEFSAKTVLEKFINNHRIFYEFVSTVKGFHRKSPYRRINDKLNKVIVYYDDNLDDEKNFNKKEKKMFIFWYLFIFARMLIKTFILQNNIFEVYSQMLASSGHKNLISRYTQVYEELGIKANNFMDEIKQILKNYENVKVVYKNQPFMNAIIIMTAKEAEKRLIMYPTEFDNNYFYNDDVNIYLPKSYLTNVINMEFTTEECSYIVNNRLKNLKDLYNNRTLEIKVKISNLYFQYLLEQNQRDIFITTINEQIHNNLMNRLFGKCQYMNIQYEGQSSGQRGQALGYNEEQEEKNKFYNFFER